MKTVMKNGFRFLFSFTLFFLAAHVATILAVTATILLDPDSRLYGWAATILLPLLSVFFAWLFFRKLVRITLSELIELSLGWGIFYALASSLLGPLFYGIPWQAEFVDIGSILIDLLILAVFFAVGYRMRVMVREPTGRRVAPDGAPDDAQASASEPSIDGVFR